MKNKKYALVGALWVVVSIVVIALVIKNDKVLSRESDGIKNIAKNKHMDKETLTSVDAVIGTGEEAKNGDVVTVHYVGTLQDGTLFDASRKHGDKGFTFTLGAGQVIKGWDIGVAGMKVGGKRTLTIPSQLAYGNQAVGGVIPANATLVFEVELLKVEKR
jgi:FKBP-type peptidyl-prolyl cis-trans isomerase